MKEFEYSNVGNVSNPVIYEPRRKTASDNSIFKIVVVLILAFCMGVAGFFVTRAISGANGNVIFTGDTTGSQLKSVNFDKYWYLIKKLEEVYPNEIDQQKLFESSLKGLVSGVGDTPTEYFTAEEYKKYKEATSGEKFSGIGIEFNTDNDAVKIINVFDDAPAKKAGLQIGDIIEKVDDESVSGLSNELITGKIKGTKGTTVKITIIRSGKSQDFSIVRDDIKVPAMFFKELDNKVAIIDINRFTAGTPDEWNRQWDSVVARVKNYNPTGGIVIDLRSNGGGFVTSSVYAASDFVEPGKNIVSEKGKTLFSDEDIKSLSSMQRLSNYKVVILVDKYTASASEIFSGALQFYGKAKVVGTDTYGKGTVQQIFDKDFKDGSAVKITIANWILPSGRVISKKTPINPDTKIEQDLDALKQGKDNVLDKGLEILK